MFIGSNSMKLPTNILHFCISQLLNLKTKPNKNLTWPVYAEPWTRVPKNTRNGIPCFCNILDIITFALDCVQMTSPHIWYNCSPLINLNQSNLLVWRNFNKQSYRWWSETDIHTALSQVEIKKNKLIEWPLWFSLLGHLISAELLHQHF